MASRALGAFLALASAALFVVSIASSAWWAGHPVVEGKEITAKHVHVGPLGATGCNTGGDGSCEPVAIQSDLQLIGYGELGATALATLFVLILLSAATIATSRELACISAKQGAVRRRVQQRLAACVALP